MCNNELFKHKLVPIRTNSTLKGFRPRTFSSNMLCQYTSLSNTTYGVESAAILYMYHLCTYIVQYSNRNGISSNLPNFDDPEVKRKCTGVKRVPQGATNQCWSYLEVLQSLMSEKRPRGAEIQVHDSFAIPPSVQILPTR